MGIQKGIFIHVPKAAGKTLYKSFGKVCPRMIHKHCTARFIKSKIDPNIWESTVKIAWSRNPWERAFSLYKYTKILKIHSMGFKEWLFDPKVKRHCMEMEGPPYYLNNPLKLETYVCDEDGGLLVDFIGRLSNIEEDFEKSKELLGNPNIKLQTCVTKYLGKNGLSNGYENKYNPEMLSYVSEVCRWEIEKFGYDFAT